MTSLPTLRIVCYCQELRHINSRSSSWRRMRVEKWRTHPAKPLIRAWSDAVCPLLSFIPASQPCTNRTFLTMYIRPSMAAIIRAVRPSSSWQSGEDPDWSKNWQRSLAPALTATSNGVSPSCVGNNHQEKRKRWIWKKKKNERNLEGRQRTEIAWRTEIACTNAAENTSISQAKTRRIMSP